MKTLFSGAQIYRNGRLQAMDLAMEDGRVTHISPRVAGLGFDSVFQLENHLLLPGFADVHVHLREPGFSYKETVATGTLAAARGGYTAICAMPNVNPPPDIVAHLAVQQDIIDKGAVIPVFPYAAITLGQRGEGELVDFAALAPCCFGFSDDGKGVQAEDLMRRAMEGIRAVGKCLFAHVEDESLLRGGYIHDGAYAKAHGHRGISSESEWRQLERDLRLVAETGCRYHMCHVSTRESVDLLRRAKARGLPVTCETGPHYLILCDEDLQEDGRFKMNPPLRGRADREALLEGIADGTIDMIATDHAPHSAEEKAKGLAGSAMGIVGLETAFGLLYTHLVKQGVLTLDKLVDLLALAPRRHFALPGGEIEEGSPADFTVIDVEHAYVIDPEAFVSKGRATPFAGWPVQGRVKMTVAGGKIVYDETDDGWSSLQ